MNPTPEGRTTLADALAALRDDLAAQPPPPASVLAAARRAARQAGRTTAAEARPAGAAPLQGTWRLPAWLGGAAVVGRGATGGLAGTFAGPWGAWAGAATCAVVLGVSLLLALRPPQPPVSETVAGPAPWSPAGGRLAGAEPVVGSAPGPGAESGLVPAMHFVPLVSPERMRALTQASGSGERPPSADTPAWVVTAELPQQRLAAMGLPYDPGHAAEPLRAELLIAGNGEVLAVRLLF